MSLSRSQLSLCRTTSDYVCRMSTNMYLCSKGVRGSVSKPKEANPLGSGKGANVPQ